jgi:predicted nucleic acid-binding protein
MATSAADSPTIVIDAGIGVSSALDVPLSEATSRAWETWRQAQLEVCAPQLWRYEVTSVLRKTLALGALEPQEAADALSTVLALDITLVPPDDDLCRAAFGWAGRLRHNAAYDGFYLAVAERLGADFYTADQRLANAARQAGAAWVYWIGNFAGEADSQA